jgi:integrase
MTDHRRRAKVDLTKRVAGEACAHPRARIGDELDLADLVDTMLGTGCRIGETLALRREVLDLDAGVAEIRGAQSQAEVMAMSMARLLKGGPPTLTTCRYAAR